MGMSKLEKEILAENVIAWGKQALAAGQYKNAEDWYNRAMQLRRGTIDEPEVDYALMYICALQRKFEEAIEHGTKAMEGQQAMSAKYIRALLYLSTNNYERGFEELDCRWGPEIVSYHFGDTPLWAGEKCKNLLVYAEQGYGDIFMFSRFVKLIKSKFDVEHIYYQVPVPCEEFFRYNFRNNPEVEIVVDRTPLKYEYVVQAISLANIFKVSYDTVPPIFLEAPPENIEKFKSYKKDGMLLVGICPEGRPNDGGWNTREWNARRNVPKEELLEALNGSREKEFAVCFLTAELNPDLKSWSDTAGAMMNCDLIISVDSGPVHMAAALGKETWLLQHRQKCWRWNLMEPNKCTWYGNNLTQIEQEKEGEWGPVFQAMKEKLRAFNV
jgi:ADP-heptose:LPS heptosyltransferase